MTFHDIIGLNDQIKGLEGSLNTGNIIQSLIILGSYGTGKKLISNIYAKALLCTGSNRPCGLCGSCIRYDSRNHPDVIIVDIEGASQIGVDTIKELHKEALIRPSESQRKVIIINNAHSMTPQAQNAMLKLLEEPPSYLSILLLCESTAPLLNTILSRCVILATPILSKNDVARGLKQKGIDADTAGIAIINSNGSIGKALDSLDEAICQKRQKICDAFFLLFEDKPAAFAQTAGLTANSRDIITVWQSLARDILLARLNQIDNIENTDKIIEISHYARKYTENCLLRLISSLCEAESMMISNTQFPLIMDWVITKI